MLPKVHHAANDTVTTHCVLLISSDILCVGERVGVVAFWGHTHSGYLPNMETQLIFRLPTLCPLPSMHNSNLHFDIHFSKW